MIGSLACASCGGPAGRGDGGGASRDLAKDSLVVSIALNAGSYAVGEPVTMKISAVNSTRRGVTLTFPTAQRFDFAVRHKGVVVWRWSTDMMFAQVLGSETIGAGDSLVFEARWNQRLSDGTNPGLGAYTIQGVLKTVPEIASQEQPFGIVD
jgi:hypothetical protein